MPGIQHPHVAERIGMAHGRPRGFDGWQRVAHEFRFDCIRGPIGADRHMFRLPAIPEDHQLTDQTLALAARATMKGMN